MNGDLLELRDNLGLHAITANDELSLAFAVKCQAIDEIPIVRKRLFPKTPQDHVGRENGTWRHQCQYRK